MLIFNIAQLCTDQLLNIYLVQVPRIDLSTVTLLNNPIMSTMYHNSQDYTASHMGGPFSYAPPEPLPTRLLPNNISFPPSVYGNLPRSLRPTFDFNTNFTNHPYPNYFPSPRPEPRFETRTAQVPMHVVEAPIDYVLTCNNAPGEKWNVISSQPFYKPGFIEKREDRRKFNYENINEDKRYMEGITEDNYTSYEESNVDFSAQPDTTTSDTNTRVQRTVECAGTNSESKILSAERKPEKTGSTRNKRRIKNLYQESMSDLGWFFFL